MKKLMIALMTVGSALTLAACASEGTGYQDQAPYADERTVGNNAPAVQETESAEKVFVSKQKK